MKSKILPKTVPIHLPFSKDNHYSMVAWVAFPDIFITPICKSVFVFNRNCSVLHEQLICFQMQVVTPTCQYIKNLLCFLVVAQYSTEYFLTSSPLIEIQTESSFSVANRTAMSITHCAEHLCTLISINLQNKFLEMTQKDCAQHQGRQHPILPPPQSILGNIYQ